MIDEWASDDHDRRHEETARRLLEQAIADQAELILFLEDDLEFNRHLRHNLENWSPARDLGPDSHFFASLYNPSIRERKVCLDEAWFMADPDYVYGSQAFLLSTATARYQVQHWLEVPGAADIKMSRLAAPVCAIYYHQPSLVQHRPVASVWGGPYHAARDFQPDWRAGAR